MAVKRFNKMFVCLFVIYLFIFDVDIIINYIIIVIIIYLFNWSPLVGPGPFVKNQCYNKNLKYTVTPYHSHNWPILTESVFLVRQHF